MRSLLAALLLVSSAAFAQQYPTKAVTIIVPYPAGGDFRLPKHAALYARQGAIPLVADHSRGVSFLSKR